ncbi:MAG TPA: hypothetical protein GXZ59_01295 [Clostridiaceae bacterium]|nr:hypothetical protein [Clostridiaceae bacterium]
MDTLLDYYRLNQEFKGFISNLIEEKREKIDSDLREVYLKTIGIFVGELIRFRRNEVGFRQIDMAAEIDVSTSFICDVERGKIWRNTFKVMQLMLALGINPVSIFSVAEKKVRALYRTRQSKLTH